MSSTLTISVVEGIRECCADMVSKGDVNALQSARGMRTGSESAEEDELCALEGLAGSLLSPLGFGADIGVVIEGGLRTISACDLLFFITFVLIVKRGYGLVFLSASDKGESMTRGQLSAGVQGHITEVGESSLEMSTSKPTTLKGVGSGPLRSFIGKKTQSLRTKHIAQKDACSETTGWSFSLDQLSL